MWVVKLLDSFHSHHTHYNNMLNHKIQVDNFSSNLANKENVLYLVQKRCL